MREIPDGYRTSHRLIVEERMTVDFETAEPGLGKLHPVYATYWLARHFELVSRKLSLPFLEPEEEGIGFEVSVRHLAPALPGTVVDLTAVFDGLKGNRLRTRCLAADAGGRLLGEGSTVQVILPRDELLARFAALRGARGEAT